jgi:hypothetical protein
MDSATVGMLVGGAGAAFAILFFALSRKPVKCPNCGREQPKVRTPTSLVQAMWGGYTCQGCGAEMDARGKLKTPKKG